MPEEIPPTRQDFQQFALDRLADALSLLAAERWTAAYYLAGYAVECALKACIAKLARPDTFPPKNSSEYYSDNLKELLKKAKLAADLREAGAVNPALDENWELVSTNWNESARYSAKAEQQARDLVAAVANEENGVLAWLQARW